MSNHLEKLEIVKKYGPQMAEIYYFHVAEDIPSNCLENAIRRFAKGLDRKTVLGFYDYTVFGTGKMGYLFTDDKVYYLETFEKPKKLWYDDIESIELINTHKSDDEMGILFHLYNGGNVKWTTINMNKPPIKTMMEELIALDRRQQTENIDNTKNDSIDNADNEYCINGGVESLSSIGNDTSNSIDYSIELHSKYFKTGQQCVDACFGNEGYYTEYNYITGKPIQIEVPSDKYDDAVLAMEEKIRSGKVPGINNPSEAKQIIRQGLFTYEQAKNVAKSRKIESLIYNSANGEILSSSVLGISSLISFAVSLWDDQNYDKSIRIATYSGIKVGGTAFVTSVLARHITINGLNSALVGSSEAFVAVLGPKASAVLVNAFRTGGNIYGAAAMKSAAKLLRANAITAGLTVVVLSTVDVVNIFRRRISGQQLFKNVANTAATVGGGTAGWLGGAAVGSAIFPGVGTIIGGLIGSVAVGSVAGSTSDKVLGSFIEDDAEAMVKIIESVFTEIADDYLLNSKEAEKIVDKLSEKLSGNKLKDMFSYSDRRKYARDMLIPIAEYEISKRKLVNIPSDDQMIASIKSLLEEISVNNDLTEYVIDNDNQSLDSSIDKCNVQYSGEEADIIRKNLDNSRFSVSENCVKEIIECYNKSLSLEDFKNSLLLKGYEEAFIEEQIDMLNEHALKERILINLENSLYDIDEYDIDEVLEILCSYKDSDECREMLLSKGYDERFIDEQIGMLI